MNKIKNSLIAGGIALTIGATALTAANNDKEYQNYIEATEDTNKELEERYKLMMEYKETDEEKKYENIFKHYIDIPEVAPLAIKKYGVALFETLVKDTKAYANDYGYDNFSELENAMYKKTIEEYNKKQELNKMTEESYEINNNTTTKAL